LIPLLIIDKDIAIVVALALIVISCLVILIYRKKQEQKQDPSAHPSPNPHDYEPLKTELSHLKRDFINKQKALHHLTLKDRDNRRNPLDIESILKELQAEHYLIAAFQSTAHNANALSHLNESTFDELYHIDIQLSKATTHVATLCQFFEDNYEQKKYNFQRQAGRLGSVYESLKTSLSRKRVPSEDKDWVLRYCTIFDQWIERGSSRAVDKLMKQIVSPVEDLLNDYGENDFTPIIRKDLNMAKSLYEDLKEMPVKITEEIKNLIKSYSKATAFIDQFIAGTPIQDEEKQPLITSVEPQSLRSGNQKSLSTQPAATTPSKAPKPSKAILSFLKKHRIVLGILLAAVLSFVGLRKFVFPKKDSNTNLTTQSNTPVPIPKQSKTYTQHYQQLTNYVDSVKNEGDDVPLNLEEAMQPYYGIDVSHLQEEINWDEVVKDARNIDFAVIKATEGQSWQDETFSHNWRNATRHFEVVGAYHFFNIRDPKKQAANFIDQLPERPPKGTFFPIIDVEKNDKLQILAERGQLVSRVKAFIEIVEQHYDTKVVIYSGQYFYDQYLKDQFNDQLFWIARYCDCDSVHDLIQESIQNPSLTEQVIAWQFTDRGKVNGISKEVDLNYVPAYFWEEAIANEE
jgi:lysozyme